MNGQKRDEETPTLDDFESTLFLEAWNAWSGRYVDLQTAACVGIES